MSSYLWRKYADHLYSKWEKTILWDMIDPYRRPKTFTPLVTIYICAFYTGVIGAAITEQLYKEKYWEEHPGEAVPIMKPKFYGGPWRIFRGDVPNSRGKYRSAVFLNKMISDGDTREPVSLSNINILIPREAKGQLSP
ncbi:Embryo defective 2752 [Heracleum sosnowskyi]|uniref:Embryo defective 2752 n=1 Tax=Heracleum sosnowskyi TaxID=360622 RepID=A0AAD8JIR3_9APIA|nr:Embryo defective 2752 [Heracleum sosnowskyi]